MAIVFSDFQRAKNESRESLAREVFPYVAGIVYRFCFTNVTRRDYTSAELFPISLFFHLNITSAGKCKVATDRNHLCIWNKVITNLLSAACNFPGASWTYCRYEVRNIDISRRLALAPVKKEDGFQDAIQAVVFFSNEKL